MVAITCANNFFQFTLIFSASFGCCNGLAYTIPLKICWDYFPSKRGMVSGIVICGFGMGSFIFSFVSTMLANPQNLSAHHEVIDIVYYGTDVAENVPGMIKKLSLSWTILCSISLICLKPLKCQDVESKGTQKESDSDIHISDLIKDKRFWHLYIMNFSSVFYGYLLIGSYKIFGGKYIDDDLYLTMVGSIGCIFGSLRFFWSMLLDLNYTYP